MFRKIQFVLVILAVMALAGCSYPTEQSSVSPVPETGQDASSIVVLAEEVQAPTVEPVPTEAVPVFDESALSHSGSIDASTGVIDFPPVLDRIESDNVFEAEGVILMEVIAPEGVLEVPATFYSIDADKNVRVFHHRLPVGAGIVVRYHHPLEIQASGVVDGTTVTGQLAEVIGYTGDPDRRVWVEMGNATIGGGSVISRNTWMQVVPAGDPLPSGYIYLGQDFIYDNKIGNIMWELLGFLTDSQENGRMPSDRMWSLFSATKIETEIDRQTLKTYNPGVNIFPGFTSQGDYVYAGGICAGASTINKTLKVINMKYASAGLGEPFVFSPNNGPHEEKHEYYMNSWYWRNNFRKLDATVMFPVQDYQAQWTGDGEAPYLHTAYDVDYLGQEMSPYPGRNPLNQPASVNILMTIWLSDKPVSDAEVQLANAKRDAFRAYLNGQSPVSIGQ